MSNDYVLILMFNDWCIKPFNFSQNPLNSTLTLKQLLLKDQYTLVQHVAYFSQYGNF